MFPNSKLLTHFPAADTEQRGGGEERLDLDPEDTWHVDTWTPAVTVSPGLINVFKPAEIGQNWFYKTIVLLSQNVTKQRWFFSQTGVIMSMSPKQVELQYSLNIITIKNWQYANHKSCQLLVKMSNPGCLHASSSWRRQIGVWVHIYIWYQDKARDWVRPPGSWRRDISNQFQKTDSAVGEFNKLLIFTSVISWDRGNGRASGRILELQTNFREVLGWGSMLTKLPIIGVSA